MKRIIVLVGLFLLMLSCISQDKQVKQVSVNNLQEVLSTNKAQLLDVRTPKEWEQGIIEGAIKINLFEENFEEEVLEKLTKEKPVYVYCRTGGRSSKASELLLKNGFEVYNVAGGYNEWKLKNK
ncbi:rhodanese-like domain-containing protein [uncultured Tenacibaculum sp.]|uniref:rhodanese-like domain-containing protein n=1 Tax=uncultured Tenacibaculum sp. TaxID=174713 RepID=UPI0026295D33|nr:rhodanese-like domain-containing protein [uncultured Tenacibaculum sp.]